MVSINTNISSLIAQNSLRNSTSKLNNAIEQMTTGYKINHAKDNAANYSIAVDMSTKIGAYEVAEENCAMGLDLTNTASEALDLMLDHSARIEALMNQIANGTYGTYADRALRQEARTIGREMERIYRNTEYNGKHLFNAATNEAESKLTFTFQVGIDNSNSSKLTMLSHNLFLNFSDLDTGLDLSRDPTLSDVREILDNIKNGLYSKQSEVATMQNRLESALEAIATQYENLVSSRSTLKDADVAEISSQYIKQQILQQASATLLATANQSPNIALQLI